MDVFGCDHHQNQSLRNQLFAAAGINDAKNGQRFLSTFLTVSQKSLANLWGPANERTPTNSSKNWGEKYTTSSEWWRQKTRWQKIEISSFKYLIFFT